MNSPFPPIRPLTLDINGLPIIGRLYVFKGWPEEVARRRSPELRDKFRLAGGGTLEVGEPILLLTHSIERKQDEWDASKWDLTYVLTFLREEKPFKLSFKDFGKFITLFGELDTASSETTQR